MAIELGDAIEAKAKLQSLEEVAFFGDSQQEAHKAEIKKKEDEKLEKAIAEEQANNDMRCERESKTHDDFFDDVGHYYFIPERSTGGTYYTVEEVYQFFKARMGDENKS